MGLVVNQLFSKRLFIAADKNGTKEEIGAVTRDGSGRVRKSLSIRCYGTVVGMILKLFGLAFKLKVGDNEFYVNKKSAVKFVIRLTPMLEKLQNCIDFVSRPIETLKRGADGADEVYRDFKKTGYDKDDIFDVTAGLNKQLKANKGNAVTLNDFEPEEEDTEEDTQPVVPDPQADFEWTN